ncbi:MAG TPA: formylglycine-generating enzyme family protein [Gemmataceae bacterium]|nr:formylglycine-generating enzyme family protein [Gemmataceae bacterium]
MNVLAVWLAVVVPAQNTRPPEPLRAPFDADAAVRGRAAWATSTGLPAEFTNSAGIALVLVPPGQFTAGPNGSTRRVSLAKPFHVGTTEVTLGQYRKFKPGHTVAGSDPAFNAEDRPAAMVSWDDAVEFCRWLSDRPDERAAGRRYALPTDAQWEWAARAGTQSARFYAPDEPKAAADKLLPEYAAFNHTYTPNPKHETSDRGRQVVGKRKPNAWGLHDVYGNVWEWTADRRADAHTGETYQPVYRGGGWRSGGSHCTSAAHDPADPKTRNDHVGFRVVCVITPQKGK